jgi:hypothetical protein
MSSEKTDFYFSYNPGCEGSERPKRCHEVVHDTQTDREIKTPFRISRRGVLVFGTTKCALLLLPVAKELCKGLALT